MFTGLEHMFTDLELVFTVLEHNFSGCKETFFFRPHQTKSGETKKRDQAISLFSDPFGARTQDPNIKSVVLYRLS